MMADTRAKLSVQLSVCEGMHILGKCFKKSVEIIIKKKNVLGFKKKKKLHQSKLVF